MSGGLLARVAASVALATASVSASADVIDFTSSAWSGANALGSFTSSGVTLTACLSATIPGCAQTLGYPRLSYSSTFGIGIRSTALDPTPGEIGRLTLTEILKVTFSAPVNITGLQFSRFGIDTVPFLGAVPEVMGVSFNGGSFTNFTANGTNPFGANYVNGGVNYLYIRGTNVASEASLFSITTVPVPATLPLIGLGLAAVVGLGRRRRGVTSGGQVRVHPLR